MVMRIEVNKRGTLIKGKARTSNRGKRQPSFSPEPYGFESFGRMMAPVTWIMDLLLKLLERIFKKVGKCSKQ